MGDEVEKLRTMPEKNRRYYLTAKSAIALSKTFQLKWVMTDEVEKLRTQASKILQYFSSSVSLDFELSWIWLIIVPVCCWCIQYLLQFKYIQNKSDEDPRRQKSSCWT